jgi:hypothetical protein
MKNVNHNSAIGGYQVATRLEMGADIRESKVDGIGLRRTDAFP